MDIFSAGCVAAEIFMDGLPLFDLARLTKYRKGLYDPSEELHKRIEDPQVVQLILKMIKLEPAERPTAVECLQ